MINNVLLQMMYGTGVAPVDPALMLTAVYTSNITAALYTHTKTGGGFDWNAGAIYEKRVNSGDADLNWLVHETLVVGYGALNKIIGFSDQSTTDGSVNIIDFGIYQAGENLYAIVNGSTTNLSTTVAIDDALQLKKEGTACKIYKNGALIYTFAASISGVQYVHTTIHTEGASFENVRLTGTDISTF